MKRTVIITGSTRGIGLATATEFLQHGDQAVIFCRHKKHVKEAKDQLQRSVGSQEILCLVGDVRKAADVRMIVAQTLKRFSRIDILVNNAGIAAMKEIGSMTDALWDDILNTNLRGAFLFSREVIPAMKKQGQGIIINVSSILGIAGEGKFSAYCASKFGMIGLTQSLADETTRHGIRVYAVLPWAVKTKLNAGLNLHLEDSDMLRPEDVAQKIVRLAAGKMNSGACSKIYP